MAGTDKVKIVETTKEYELALANFDIDRKVLRDLITYGFKRSFYFGGYPDKRAYVRKNIDYFDKIWEQDWERWFVHLLFLASISVHRCFSS